ncbi:MAG: hypothetical protein HOE90_24505 [Bacteriovoracaceae bacterium]|nr:hypothetical protein [Bacteriovoracaceae bacterium]
MEISENYSRLTGEDTFLKIAKQNLNRFDKLNPQLLKLREKISAVLTNCDDTNNPPREYYDLYNEINPIEDEWDQCCIVSVVFTAMYFEAFIYDYAASYLGDDYSKSHLDKLDFISKWLVIPKLITGKELSKEGQAYQALKRLHKDRNSLVHLKSKKFKMNHSAIFDHLQKREKNIRDSVKNCRIVIEQVINELVRIDPKHLKVRLANKSHN